MLSCYSFYSTLHLICFLLFLSEHSFFLFSFPLLFSFLLFSFVRLWNMYGTYRSLRHNILITLVHSFLLAFRPCFCCYWSSCHRPEQLWGGQSWPARVNGIRLRDFTGYSPGFMHLCRGFAYSWLDLTSPLAFFISQDGAIQVYVPFHPRFQLWMAVNKSHRQTNTWLVGY